MKHCIVVVIYGRIIILIKHVLIDQFPDSLLGQVRVHRAGTIAQKSGEMMHFPGFAGLQDQGHPGPLLGPHQVLVQGRYRQQGRNGHMVLVHSPVRQDQYIHAIPVSPVRLHKQPVDGPLQTGIFIIKDGNDFRPEALRPSVFDFQQIRVGEDGIVHPQYIAVSGVLLQDIALGTNVHCCGSHNLLPYGIDGRIGHLSEKLFKIVEQGLRGPAENRQGYVHPHGGDGFRPVLRHRQDTAFHLIISVAESLLHPLPFLPGIFRHTGIWYGKIL